MSDTENERDRLRSLMESERALEALQATERENERVLESALKDAAERELFREERDAALAQAEAAELRAEGWENTHNQVKAQWKEAVERAEKAERERDAARELSRQQYNQLVVLYQELGSRDTLEAVLALKREVADLASAGELLIKVRDAARTEVSRLRTRVAELETECQRRYRLLQENPEVERARTEATELRAEVERLREVLGFYAEPRTWEVRKGKKTMYTAASNDQGKRAREALKGAKTE